MSTHTVSVIRVKPEKHPNADNLSIVRIGGYTVCVRTCDWKGGQLGAYVPPDSLVDVRRGEFSFLADVSKPVAGYPAHLRRVKVRTLRGVPSAGLLVPAPAGLGVGDDAADALTVEHYEPPVPATLGGETEHGPALPGGVPVYDVESLRSPRFRSLFTEGEEAVVTEKLHGCNARYVFFHNRMWAGSRAQWKRFPYEAPRPSLAKRAALRLSTWFPRLRRRPFFRPERGTTTTLWHHALTQNAWIEGWCRAHPGDVLYGEVFGQVQDLKYGTRPGSGTFLFRAFDVLRAGRFLPVAELEAALPAAEWRVPHLYRGPFSAEKVEALAEGPSLIPGAEGQVREGCVVRAVGEERRVLKVVGNGYLERA